MIWSSPRGLLDAAHFPAACLSGNIWLTCLFPIIWIYVSAGATIAADRAAALAESDAVLKVLMPEAQEAAGLKEETR